MDLEKKVQLLEQEIEVLKNQIQASLLDIREHLLTNAYPSLRADETLSLQSKVPASIQAPKPSEDSGEPEQASLVRRVSLSELNETLPTPKLPEKKDLLDPETKSELNAWLNRLLRETSPDRCAEMIELYSETGRFTPLKRDYLLQNLKQQAQASVKPNLKAKTAPHKSSSTASGPKPAATKASKPVKAAQAKRLSSSSDEVLDKNNLVLRLIAGIQNAGAGVRWNRKNG